MKMTAKFEAEGESFNACFKQLNSAFNAEFSASGGGQDGKDGATFTPSVSEDGVISWTNDRELPNPAPVNIKGENGITPVKGIDYFTEQDAQEIAERAAQLVDIPEGGVTSWNDLTDKPFGESSPAFDITWDGDMAGHDNFLSEENYYFVKVSDEVYTKEQLLNSTMYYSDGHDYTPTEEDIVVVDEVGFINLDDIFVIFSAEAFIGATGFPEGSVSNGVWFGKYTGEGAYYVNRFVASPIIKTLDNKYLDLEGYAKTEDLEGFAKTEDLSAVATSGSYNDLDDRPNFAQIATSGSWNDLQDKPFGEGPSRWVEVVSRFKVTPTQADNGSYTATVELSFTPKYGTKYKIIVTDGQWPMVIYEHECVGTVRGNYPVLGRSMYMLGTSGDPVFAYSYVPAGDIPTRWTFEFQRYDGQSGYKVEIYEAKPTLILLDEKFLSETVVLESELDAKGYQTEAQVTALINDALGVIENGSY